MNLFQQNEHAALRLVYTLAIWLRSILWRIQRPTLIGVRALIMRDGAVLLIRHRAGQWPWSLPGGGVKRHERLADAIRREAYEETGAHVRVEQMQGVYDRFDGGITNYVAVFVCTLLGDPCPPRSVEIAEARFFPLDTLPTNTDPGTCRRIAEFAAGEHGVSRLW